MPAYDLKTAQALVAAQRFSLDYANTIVKVSERLCELGQQGPGVEKAANALIGQVFASLTVNDLSAKPWPALGKRPAMDEYGARDGQGRTWYVKFFITRGGDVRLCSFHRPEYDMTTVGGVLPR